MASTYPKPWSRKWTPDQSRRVTGALQRAAVLSCAPRTGDGRQEPGPKPTRPHRRPRPTLLRVPLSSAQTPGLGCLGSTLATPGALHLLLRALSSGPQSDAARTKQSSQPRAGRACSQARPVPCWGEWGRRPPPGRPRSPGNRRGAGAGATHSAVRAG